MCNECSKIVPATTEVRGDRVYLVKTCPDCGPTETLISTHSDRYLEKIGVDHASADPMVCTLECDRCVHPKTPDVVFVDITNRCNMNCPICLTNVPNMKFVFEPSLDYFDTLFKELGSWDPKPTVQLFGGEPTVREDLVQIVRIGRRQYGLNIRIATNGLKLADPEYLNLLLEKRTKIMLSYDGADPEMYKQVRGTDSVIALKQKALDNIHAVGTERITILTLVAKDHNADNLNELLTYLHTKRSCLKQIYFLPLAHIWEDEDWDYDPIPMTTEDIEDVIDSSFADESVKFWPAGFWGQMPAFLRCFNVKFVPFRGAHPGCESMYILVSDGQEYRPLSWYLRSPMPVCLEALLAMEARLAKRVAKLDNSWWGRWLDKMGWKQTYMMLTASLTVVFRIRKHMRVMRFFQGKGLTKVWNMIASAAKFLTGGNPEKIRAKHTTIQDSLLLLVLPPDDRFCVETDRLKRCAAAWAYVDPADDQVKTIPFCAWNVKPAHKEQMMRDIAAKYNAEKYMEAAVAE